MGAPHSHSAIGFFLHLSTLLPMDDASPWSWMGVHCGIGESKAFLSPFL